MQPLAYFAVRSLLGWLQFIERQERAFASNALLLAATGAAHCWAVVYALFIAIHTRAMRYDGYHEGYTEHLPFWVSWTETLSVASMAIWWAAGFTNAAIRILDDEARGLPVDAGDVDVGMFFKIIRSTKLHEALAFAHTLSCVGLFSSILLLCVAMALMKGVVTSCELCLVFVAVGFALPHAVVAWRQLNLGGFKTGKDAVIQAPAPAAEAAAQEAAALGPQLSVLLALADSPGHAYIWQNLVYLFSAVAFLGAVAACGRSPPKVGDAALPPDVGEFVTCIVLDAAASIALIICFPHLNSWHLAALFAVLVALFIAVWFEGWRDIFVDFLDPLFVVRSDTDKALPGQQRQRLRGAAWVTTLSCAAVTLWDITLHPIQEGLFEPPEHGDVGFHDPWDQNTMLLLRWLPPPLGTPDEKQLLSAASSALGVETSTLNTQTYLVKHRLLVFKYTGPPENTTELPMHAHWHSVRTAPGGRLAQLLDTTFPGALNVTLCLQSHEALLHHRERHAKAAKSDTSPDDNEYAIKDLELPADFIKSVGPTSDAHAAYMAGCDWWTEILDALTDTEIEHHDDDEHTGAAMKRDAKTESESKDDVAEDGDDIAVD